RTRSSRPSGSITRGSSRFPSTGISEACSRSSGQPLRPRPAFAGEESRFMGLLVRAPKIKPPTMPKGGGAVTFVFEARSTGATTAQRTRYSIAAQQPYVFDNATDPLDPRIVVGAGQEVTLDPNDQQQRLVLRKISGPDALM